MASPYTVKAGDTLGAIAKRMGTSVDNLTGFRSGNANLIYPGEIITVKNSPNSEALDRSNNIRSELGVDVAPASTLTDTPKTGGFDFASLQTQLADTQKKKEDAFKKLEGFQTKRYDELTKERNLDGTRSEVSKLDDLITQKKNERDAAIATIRKNPGASAATLTGEVSVATDKLNAEINNLIGQRNAKAGDYNTALSEIDSIVGREAKDLQSALGFYEGSEKEMSSLIQSYQKALMDQLRREEDRNFKIEDDLRDFEQALELARMKEASGGSGGSGSGSGLTPYQTFQATQSLKKTNQKNIAASQELKRQTDIINNTWNRLASGQAKDLNATSQAIIITFNKILDPTSVVRESEYDRTGQGQALLSNIQGKIAAISQGGPGLTRASLQELVNLGNTYAKNAESYIQESNRRAEEEARFFGINPDFVTSTQIPNQMDSTPTGNTYTVETPAIMNTEENKGGLVNWFKGLFK